MKTTNTVAGETKTMSAAQHERLERRNGAGKFVKNPCECCAKGAPMTDYFSDVREVEGKTHQFITLCGRCATKLGDLSDADFAAFETMHTALVGAW